PDISPFPTRRSSDLFGLARQMTADLKGEAIETEAAPLREQLKRILAPASRRDIDRQIARHGVPALEEVRAAVTAEGLENSEVQVDDNGAWLRVEHANGRDFLYRLGARSRPRPALTALEAPEGRRALEWRLGTVTGDGSRPRDVTGFTRAQIVADVLEHLQRWRLAA